MSIFLVAFAVFAIAMLGMAIGVIISSRRLRGSCGGLAGLQDEHGNSICEACTTPAEACSGIADGQRRSAEQEPARR